MENSNQALKVELGYEGIYSSTPYLKEDSNDDGTVWYIDLVYVPPHLRGNGVGANLVKSFLETLPKQAQRVRLLSCELGSGNTRDFWEDQDFSPAYSGDIDGPEGDLSDIMVIGVNGTKTPPPEVLTANNNDREMHESKEDNIYIKSLTGQ